MASPQERARNNVRAGIFVTVALLITFGVVIALTDAVAAFDSTRSYRIRFTVESGVQGLSVGSEVRVGGMPMGRVTAIEPVFADTGALETIIVEVELDADVTLYDNAVAVRIAPLLGNVAWINFPDVGSPDETGANVLAAGAMLDARSDLGLLTTLLGPDTADDAGQIVGSVSRLSGFIDRIPAEYDERIRPALDNTNALTADARELVADLRHERWPRWAEAIDHAMSWITRATGDLDVILADGRVISGDARLLVSENRPKIDAALSNVQTVTDQVVEAEIVAKVDQVVQTAQSALGEAEQALSDLRVQLDTAGPQISDTLANMNLASQQLKLAAIEIRRNPWRILYRPQQYEVEHELLYNAARAFALAVTDLKAASESVQRVLERHPEMLEDDPNAADRLREMLIDRVDEYEQAQSRLLEILLEHRE